jgi:hypothetical protein
MEISTALFAAQTIELMKKGQALIRHADLSAGGERIEGVLEAQALLKIVRAGLYDLRTVRGMPHGVLDALTALFDDAGIELDPLSAAQRVQRILAPEADASGDATWLASLWELAECLLVDSDEETIQELFSDAGKDPGFRAVWLLDSLSHEAEYLCHSLLKRELEDNALAGTGPEACAGAQLCNSGDYPNIRKKLGNFLAETDERLKHLRHDAALENFVSS